MSAREYIFVKNGNGGRKNGSVWQGGCVWGSDNFFTGLHRELVAVASPQMDGRSRIIINVGYFCLFAFIGVYRWISRRRERKRKRLADWRSNRCLLYAHRLFVSIFRDGAIFFNATVAIPSWLFCRRDDRWSNGCQFIVVAPACELIRKATFRTKGSFFALFIFRDNFTNRGAVVCKTRAVSCADDDFIFIDGVNNAM